MSRAEDKGKGKDRIAAANGRLIRIHQMALMYPSYLPRAANVPSHVGTLV